MVGLLLLRTVLYLPCSSPLGSVRHVQHSFLQERCIMYSVLYSDNSAQCAVSLITVDNLQLPQTPLFFAEKSTPCKHLSGVQYSYLLGKICMSASSVVRIPLSQEQYPICGISTFLLEHTPCKEVFSAVDNTLRAAFCLLQTRRVLHSYYVLWE